MLNNLMTHCLGWKRFRKILPQANSSYFNKMVLHNSRDETGLQYEPKNLDVNKVCCAK